MTTTKRTTKTDKDDAIRNAAKAGDLVRFFLNGGNGATLPTRESVAGMVLAKLDALLDPEVHDALLHAAGFRWTRGPMGAPTVTPKDVLQPPAPPDYTAPTPAQALRVADQALKAASLLAWEVGTETVDGVATLLDDSRGDLYRTIAAARDAIKSTTY